MTGLNHVEPGGAPLLVRLSPAVTMTAGKGFCGCARTGAPMASVMSEAQRNFNIPSP